MVELLLPASDDRLLAKKQSLLICKTVNVSLSVIHMLVSSLNIDVQMFTTTH